MTDPTAVMGRRIVAFILDGLIAAVLLGLIVVPMFTGKATKNTWPTASAATAHCNEVNSALSDRLDETDGQLTGNDRFCANVNDTTYEMSGSEFNEVTSSFYGIWLGVAGLNLILLQGLTGASVGKFVMGIRVVRQDGTKAGFGWNILRTLLLVVDTFCCYLVGLITSNRSAGHKRVGDMAASTFVVSKSAVGTPLQIPGLSGGAYSAQPYGAPAQPYGAPAQWGAPPTTPGAVAGAWAPPADATQQMPQTPGADGPTWDAARNTYIQYDREVAAWVQWDDNAKAWRPIDQ